MPNPKPSKRRDITQRSDPNDPDHEPLEIIGRVMSPNNLTTHDKAVLTTLVVECWDIEVHAWKIWIPPQDSPPDG